MPYNSSTSKYERRSTTVIDATPDGDTVAVAIDVKLDQGIDDYVTDLNHHAANGRHYPATSVASDSRFLKQSPAGVVSWADGVVAAAAALKDFSNVASGAISNDKLAIIQNDKLAPISPSKIAQDASNRFVTDTEKSTWNGALYDKADVEGVLTGTITSHTHSAASESAAGLVELATIAEAAAGEDTNRAVTAAGVDAYHKANNIKLGVSVAASGTAVDFVGIPEGVKRITVMFNGVSTNGTSLKLIQIGDSGGIETTGYVAGAAQSTASSSYDTSTAGFVISVAFNSTAADTMRGAVVFTNINGNAWVAHGVLHASSYPVGNFIAGSKTLSATLDRVRITTVNGTDLFDAGTINISWEF